MLENNVGMCILAKSGTRYTLSIWICVWHNLLSDFESHHWVWYRASLGWFVFAPEWYDANNMSFAQSKAQSVSVFVHYLSNERVDANQSDSKGRARENGSIVVDVVILLIL